MAAWLQPLCRQAEAVLTLCCVALRLRLAAHHTVLAPELAVAFHTREDLRGIVAAVLVRLCKQARGVAAAAAAGALEAPQQTLDSICALGLVSAAAAAVPGPGQGGEGPGDEEDEEAQPQQQGGDDSDDEYADDAQPQQRQRGQRGRGSSSWSLGGGGSAEDAEDQGPDAPGCAPSGFSAAVALAQLTALRATSAKWLPLMCKVFLAVRPGA